MKPQGGSGGLSKQPNIDGDDVTVSFSLHNLDVIFPRDKMTLITGKYGSGKTLMLLALLGEARLVKGNISYAVSNMISPNSMEHYDWKLAEHGVAYVPQVRQYYLYDVTY